MQAREHSEGMSKSEMGLQSLGQDSQKRVWNREGWVGLSTWSFKTELRFVDGWDTW